MVIQVVPQMKGEPGIQGPEGVQGPQGPQGPEFVEQARLALDKRAYVRGVDESISVYGSGFARDEYVLPQILGANPRGFTAEGVNAGADGTFSTTISLVADLESPNIVDLGVYTLRVTGGEGTVMTIPVVIGEK